MAEVSRAIRPLPDSSNPPPTTPCATTTSGPIGGRARHSNPSHSSGPRWLGGTARATPSRSLRHWGPASCSWRCGSRRSPRHRSIHSGGLSPIAVRRCGWSPSPNQGPHAPPESCRGGSRMRATPPAQEPYFPEGHAPQTCSFRWRAIWPPTPLKPWRTSDLLPMPNRLPQARQGGPTKTVHGCLPARRLREPMRLRHATPWHRPLRQRCPRRESTAQTAQ